MSEYIITDKQLKTATEAYLEHELSRPITEVFISGDKLPEIVRCRDCKEFAFGDVEYATVDWCDYWGAYVESPDGFCAWGEGK